MFEPATARITFKCLGCGQRFDAARQYHDGSLWKFPVCSAQCHKEALHTAQTQARSRLGHILTCTIHHCTRCQRAL